MTALADLRVVEMGQLLAGPFCGQLLADFGADVIKVEPPGQGDPMREWGREKSGGKSLWWPVVARGKRSITLNLREAKGQELARRLLEDADVLVENFRPGTIERWGMAPEELWAINPRLIIVRVSGYGQTGPYADRPGYGAIGEAMGGLRAVIGEPDRPPSRAGISIGDTLAAIFACVGCLVALHVRERTGRGQVVDSALYEATLAVMESLIPEYTITGYVRPRTGSILPNVAPANAYPTKDGKEHLISGNQDTVWKRLAEAMDRPELGDDERYATHNARGRNQAELDRLIGEWSATLTAAELEDRLNEFAVPNGKIYTAPDMLEDPHFAAREAVIKLAHPLLGEFPMQNVAPKLSDTPGEVRWVGPELGEHTDEVLSGLLGLSRGEQDALRDAGII
jgi:formyl-CoA transferase